MEDRLDLASGSESDGPGRDDYSDNDDDLDPSHELLVDGEAEAELASSTPVLPPSSKKGKNKVSTMSEALDGLAGRESDADPGPASGESTLERTGTKGNPAESRRVREFPLPYCSGLRLLMVYIRKFLSNCLQH